MISKFRAAMAKLATTGQIRQLLTDCSEVIPVPVVAKSQAVTLPAGKSMADVQAAVRVVPLVL